MAIEINKFRLSFLWTATLLGPDGPASPAFGQRTDYESLFDSTRGGGGFTPPWPEQDPPAHKFWVLYLGQADPAQTSGADAWRFGVPLRAAQPLATATTKDWFSGRISIEHFFYPFGAALAVTFFAAGTFEDKAWVDLILSASREPLDITFAGEAAKPMKLSAFADESLKRVRGTFFGPQVSPLKPADPFTIATVISGKDVDATEEPVAGGIVHRMLFGAASRLVSYDTATLGKLVKGETLLDIRGGAAPGDVVFAAKRGRAIWFPSSFAKTEGRRVSLSCYHRNQLFAALQADALCSLALDVAGRTAANPDLPAALNQLGRLPAEILPDLHDGKDTTYRSGSLKHQIAARAVKKPVNDLRARYGLPLWV